MKKISLNIDKALGKAVTLEKVNALESKINQSLATLHKGDGAGNDFLGWLHLPSSITDADLKEIEETAAVLRSKCEVVVVIGIGGSYLGTKAVVEALNNSFDWLHTDRKNPVLVYAGHNIGEDYLYELTEILKGKQFGLINISKSGTTTEPALAFRILKKQLEETVGKAEAKHRIVAVTDHAKGALRKLATQEGYKTFVIPDNVGGRFSVLTPVGLLPIAVAGINIRDLVAGAVSLEKATDESIPFKENIASVYAAIRNILYAEGKKIEILANFHPKLHYIGEWWKQLYGESEGKENKGIFPASVDFTTDLHSMGQWIQDGERIIFETVISVENPDHKLTIPTDEANLDGLNFLAGKRVDEVNKMAELGTQLAHVDGGVPNIKITLPEVSAYFIGQLFYFFEKACGISGYTLGVNPFDQPGVEAYKKNMFALLNKPGYEKESEAIKAKL
ncbi:glucose-6-phosphate isomerase [Parabacteroides sp. Marseille-P3160]|uniref:glucose-6-phosphate isomerase n=1 Tax=Parabacteroides sp. Marseille-P3160 TaxID=1917887 RepID=UPI0009BC0D32|nr:glucose-6-phosphate isomerase [Parabacteroides sp. Marseille-P3160]